MYKNIWYSKEYLKVIKYPEILFVYFKLNDVLKVQEFWKVLQNSLKSLKNIENMQITF